MNKAELIEEVQRELGADCSKAHAERVVNAVLAGIGKGLQDDRIVQLNEGPPPEPPVRLARTGPAGTLFLQAAAFSSEDYAERARGMLRGVGPVKITPFVRGDRTLYRVRVGPYADRNTAMTALERLREVGFEGAHLVASS